MQNFSNWPLVRPLRAFQRALCRWNARVLERYFETYLEERRRLYEGKAQYEIWIEPEKPPLDRPQPGRRTLPLEADCTRPQ